MTHLFVHITSTSKYLRKIKPRSQKQRKVLILSSVPPVELLLISDRHVSYDRVFLCVYIHLWASQYALRMFSQHIPFD